MTYKTRFQYLLDKARDIAQAQSPQNPKLPPLFFFTDPKRTPHPEDIAIHMPAGCGIVYRHFGEGHASQRARLLRKIARDNGLTLLIGEDDTLALEIEADGVHLRQASIDRAAGLHAARPSLILTAACHDAETLRALDTDSGLSAIFISPVFASHSPSAQGVVPLGVNGAREMTELSSLPVYGLGGIGCDNILSLKGSGLAGIGAVDAFKL
ncbi:thiamine phosphate synthase [Asticcacaulis taihuensis]|uniref:Thiamine-phosphate pyrophosphorylase n=1 Tax=Asticcacaulis taihuensis TaxID=260084 RepID=A0A1G4T2R3_9CAUL|nr:thiamine phosphate synthase [Asticcacaulis taihuensis]SCW74819.1 thiamine-phosphate pyrophosphorylase [Asticcacaulis taihuensis]